MIVYSAVFGGYDSTPDAPFSETCPHVLFTDTPPDDPKGWEVRVVERRFESATRENRYYKLQPHVFFPGETTLYHDGNLTPKRDPQSIWELFGRGDLAMPRHPPPHRRTAAEEFAAVRELGLVADTVLDRQLARYAAAGVDLTMPIPWAAIRIATPKAASFMAAWWSEVEQFAVRDQLSYAYARHLNPNLRVNLSTVERKRFAQRRPHLQGRVLAVV